MNLKRLFLILCLPVAFSSYSCNQKIIVHTKVRKVTNPVFGNFDFELSQKELESKGINYDDLLEFTFYNPLDGGQNVVFEAAFVKNYNEVGYFAPSLCNYGGSNERPEISFGIMPEKDHVEKFVGWDVQIEVIKKGGYRKTRELVDVANKLSYEELGKDNLAYANFRDVIQVGTIGNHMHPNRLFRGSSPFNPKDNPDNRDKIADNYLSLYDIKSEISLANSQEDIDKLMEQLRLKRPNSNSLAFYDESKNKQILADKSFFGVNLGNDYYTTSVPGKDGDNAMRMFEYIALRCGNTTESSPIYIHCNEGKDRTGFVIMVLEALCGVPIEDIEADAMLTFKNYYNVSIENNEEKYNTLANLLIYRHVYSILIENPSENLAKINWYEFDAKKAVKDILNDHPNHLKEGAYNYLKSINLSEDHIKTLVSWASKIN